MMAKLTEFTSYSDAQKFATSDALWELFDGDRSHLNIAHECILHPVVNLLVYATKHYWVMMGMGAV